MTENIDSFQEEVKSYLKNENFNIFVSKRNTESKALSEIFWDENQNWKDFFTIAKNEGVNTIIEEIEVFSEDDLESFEESWDDDEVSSELDEIKNGIKQNFEKNIGTIGTISFFWIKDSVKYSLSKQSEGYKELNKQVALMKIQKENDDKPEEEDTTELDALLEEEPNDLAEKMIEWFEKEYPGTTGREMHLARREFFDSLGFPVMFNEKARTLKEKTTAIVFRIMEEKEKEKMPELINECIKWGEENNLKKLTKAHMTVFLSEKDCSLSGTNEDILYTRVNFKLKSK